MVVKDFLFACAAFYLFPALGAIAQDQGEQTLGTQASTAGLVAARGESASFAQRRSAAVTAFSDAHPRADVYSDGTRITRVFGTIFGSGSSPRETAQQFRTKHAMMFGVEPEDLQPVDLPGNQVHGQPVMYDRQTGEYKFSLVSYGQRRNGVPVFRADLKLLVRNESGYPLVLAAADLRNVGEFSPALVDVNSLDSALWRNAAQEFVPSLVNFTEPELVIWAGVDDTVVQPALAVSFVGDNEGGANRVHLERWLFVADVTTGEILHREELVFHFCGDADDVVGNVEGLATPRESGPGICASDVAEPMPYARVNIAGETAVYADENGDFCIPHEGTAMVTVESRVWGEFFRVHNLGGVPGPPPQSFPRYPDSAVCASPGSC